MNEPTITVTHGRLRWLMVFYAENLAWVNNRTLPNIKNPYHYDSKKKTNKIVAFHLTMIEHQDGYDPETESQEYKEAQKLYREIIENEEAHYFDSLAHAHYM